jgi:hypothetical protein
MDGHKWGQPRISASLIIHYIFNKVWPKLTLYRQLTYDDLGKSPEAVFYFISAKIYTRIEASALSSVIDCLKTPAFAGVTKLGTFQESNEFLKKENNRCHEDVR